MRELETQNAELIEQINSLQAAYGRMVDEHFEEKKELKAQLAKANETISKLESESLPDDYIAVPSKAWHEQCQYEVQLAEVNKRIEELEHYNLGLANESHNKSLEIDRANERVKELDEIADTAFKYNHSSAQCLRAWNKLQQLRKEQEHG